MLRLLLLLIGMISSMHAFAYPHRVIGRPRPYAYEITFIPDKSKPHTDSTCAQLPATLLLDRRHAYQPDHLSHVVVKVHWNDMRFTHDTLHFSGTMSVRLLLDGEITLETLFYQGVGVKGHDQMDAVFSMPGCEGRMLLTFLDRPKLLEGEKKPGQTDV